MAALVPVLVRYKPLVPLPFGLPPMLTFLEIFLGNFGNFQKKKSKETSKKKPKKPKNESKKNNEKNQKKIQKSADCGIGDARPRLTISQGPGAGMTPGCIVVCSGRRPLADRHSPLPFPWALSLRRRRCPSASHPLMPLIPLPGLPPPSPFPFPRGPRTFLVSLLRVGSTRRRATRGQGEGHNRRLGSSP